MNLLLLGGTGAMGRCMVQSLSGGCHQLTITSRCDHKSFDNVVFKKCNAQIYDEIMSVLNEQEWDVIVDFMVYPFDYFKKIIPFLLKSTKHYFFFSSARVYAEHEVITEESSRLLDVDKDIEYLQSDEYALIKSKEENFIHEQDLKNWTIIRPYITYDTYRLQLGVQEKEDWLWRALKGKTIIFDSVIAEKYTTMTSAWDVSQRIIALFDNDDSLGETFHITNTVQMKWKDILNIYINKLEQITGKYPKVIYVDMLKEGLKDGIWRYQLSKDRYYNRRFDNSKIIKYTGLAEFVSYNDGISKALEQFLLAPKFLYTEQMYAEEGRRDKITGEYENIFRIPGLKNKLKYIKWRFLI